MPTDPPVIDHAAVEQQVTAILAKGSPDCPSTAELSDAVYRDIAFADTKAGFAMTVAALGVAATASFFGSMPDADSRVVALKSPLTLIPLGLGIVLAFAAMVSAALTVLPRRYVRGLRKPPLDDQSPMYEDAQHVLTDASPQYQPRQDGAVDLFEGILHHLESNERDKAGAVWLIEVGRQIEVRRRKYWWVGPAVGMAALSVIFFVVGVVIAVILINRMPPGSKVKAAPAENCLHKIVSGGQTGADRAALDVAIEKGLDHGGWLPRGRQTEAGPLPARFVNMRETTNADPKFRTEMNVKDSDGTVIVSVGAIGGGTRYTEIKAREHRKPLLRLNLRRYDHSVAGDKLARWIVQHRVATLNVAGPRESEDATAYKLTRSILLKAIERLRDSRD